MAQTDLVPLLHEVLRLVSGDLDNGREELLHSLPKETSARPKEGKKQCLASKPWTYEMSNTFSQQN